MGPERQGFLGRGNFVLLTPQPQETRRNEMFWNRMVYAPKNGEFIMVRIFRSNKTDITIAGWDKDVRAWMKKDGTYIRHTPHGWCDVEYYSEQLKMLQSQHLDKKNADDH
jgi:hypothetical protein